MLRDTTGKRMPETDDLSKTRIIQI